MLIKFVIQKQIKTIKRCDTFWQISVYLWCTSEWWDVWSSIFSFLFLLLSVTQPALVISIVAFELHYINYRVLVHLALLSRSFSNIILDFCIVPFLSDNFSDSSLSDYSSASVSFSASDSYSFSESLSAKVPSITSFVVRDFQCLTEEAIFNQNVKFLTILPFWLFFTVQCRLQSWFASRMQTFFFVAYES